MLCILYPSLIQYHKQLEKFAIEFLSVALVAVTLVLIPVPNKTRFVHHLQIVAIPSLFCSLMNLDFSHCIHYNLPKVIKSTLCCP